MGMAEYHYNLLIAVWDEKERSEAEQLSIECRKIGCASPSAIDDQELQFHQPALSDDGACAAGSREFCNYGK
jgi:hypothetical protein